MSPMGQRGLDDDYGVTYQLTKFILFRPHWPTYFKLQTHVQLYILHIVTTFRVFIKSPEEGRLDCPKYRENKLTSSFLFLCCFFCYRRLLKYLKGTGPLAQQHLALVQQVNLQVTKPEGQS